MQNILFFILFSVMSSMSLAGQDFNRILKEGDLIFHKSQSPQSNAILEATGSEWSHVGIIVKKNSVWYVAEARNGVEITLLTNFIERGKNKDFKVLRFKSFRDEMRTSLHQELAKYLGKKYDIYFEFSDERIYCSELTYKVMKQLTGEEIGIVNKMKELRLDGPYVQELIKRRLIDLGKELNPEEQIVTPVSQMLDLDLEFIISSQDSFYESLLAPTFVDNFVGGLQFRPIQSF